MIDEAEAVEIARRAVAADGTCADRATYDARWDGDCWWVHARQIVGYGADGAPLHVFGGDRFVKIAENSKVVRYRKGR